MSSVPPSAPVVLSKAPSPAMSSPQVPSGSTEENSSVWLEALDKLLDSKLSKFDSRLSSIESKLTGSPACPSSHAHRNNNILQSGVSGVSGSGSLSHYFLPPPPNCASRDKEGGVETADLKKEKDLLLKQRLKASDEFVHDCLSSIKTEIVDSLSSFDNKMSEFSLVLEKQDETISSVHKKIENSVPENEIKNLIPKIVQLQKNLDALLAGESETNAIIDNVIPTMSKLQKDVEEFIVSQKKESTKLNEEMLPKVQKSLGDIYEKTKDIKVELIDNAVQILDKSSKISKSADDVKARISRLEEKVMRFSPSEQRNRSKDHATRSSSSSRRLKGHASEEHRSSGREGSSKKLIIDSDSDSENDKSKSVSVSDDVKIYKEIRSQLGTVTRGIEHLEKEIRKCDTTELLPNIYAIRKSMDQLVPSNANNQVPIKKLEPPGRTYYSKSATEDTSRKRFGADHSKSSKSRGGSVVTELVAESEDLARSRSPKGNASRAGSRDSDIKDRSKEERKKPKERSSSPDSEDGEIQIMERQIDKISVAVVEIQDKMDSWLKYSKKTIAKSDENTGHLMEKLCHTSSVVNAIHSKVDAIPGSLDKTLESKVYLKNSISSNTSPMPASKGGGSSVHSETDSSQINSYLESTLSEFSSTFERHFFELSNKIDSSIGKPTYKADEVITTTLLHRLDDLISRTKKSDSYIKSNNENTAKIFSLLKKIECSEKAILGEMQKNISSLSKEALDEIKKANDKNEFVKREDSEHIQKILDLVEDIKEERISEHPSGGHGESNINQIYNALNDLKITMNSKDTNTSRLLNELKADNSKLFGRVNETIKACKSIDKSSLKMCSTTEELRKNNVTDAKTLSQINTVLQGLKASGPAYEKQVLNSIKDLKEHMSAKVSELPSIDYMTPYLKSREENMDFLTAQSKSLKKLIEELIDKVNVDETQNIQQLLDSTQTIILEMFSKELKQTEKNILEIGTSLESQLEKSEARNSKSLSTLDDGLKTRFDQVETYLNTQFKDIQEIFSFSKNVLPNKKNAKKSDLVLSSADLSAKIMEIERKMLTEKEYNSLMDELCKYQKHSSEILNSVEDLKILTSSTPTAIHEILPKIEKIHSIILELPNEYLTTMAATEENLCVNLDAKIKDQHQLTLQEIFDKFDHMDSRLAVIKKYAKHGPMGMKPAPGSTPAHSTTSQDSSSEEPKHEQRVLQNSTDHSSVSRQLSEMKSQLLEEMRCIKEDKSSQDSFQASILAMMEEIKALDKRIFQEQAKGLVVEDQLEALCNTLLQPIQKLGCGDEIIVSHNNETLSTSILNSLEDKQMQCLDLLSDLWSSFRGVIRHSPGNIVDKEAFSTSVKTAVEAATCPQVVTSSRSSSNGNEDSSDPLDKESHDRIDSINKLIAYFKKVQDLEVDIISKCNRSIELQAQLNEHLNSVVPNVDRVRTLLEGLAPPECDAKRDKSLDALDVLCEDIIEHLKRITELSHKSSEPRSKSIDELKEFVQLSVSVMERLLKEDDNEEAQNNRESSLVLNMKDNYLAHNSSVDGVNQMDSEFSDMNATQAKAARLAENHVMDLAGSRKSLRKRKIGPRSCLSGYVDQGPLVIEQECISKLNNDSSISLMDQRLQPVVKLVKGVEKSKKSKITESLQNPTTSSCSNTTLPLPLTSPSACRVQEEAATISSIPQVVGEVILEVPVSGEPTSSSFLEDDGVDADDGAQSTRPPVTLAKPSMPRKSEEEHPSKRICVRKEKQPSPSESS